jgi:hypothetical protein
MAGANYNRRAPDYVFLRDRHRAYSRSKCQADYRGEGWELTLEDWNQFWTEERWPLRGRSNESLMMTRWDPELPWSRANCCLVDRLSGASIRNLRRYGMPVEKFYDQAITI